MRDVLDVLLGFVAWWVPVVYFAGAGVITYKVAGNNERTRNWMVGLFIAVFVLAVLWLTGWHGSLDEP
ncbi:hypothetical protein [Mesorhizobium sp. L2C066B000]|uniref:hypothetical protein n=1 Tax=Mesorhizobium sp. L2C066B000 TaxID=1287105 RepID=UPI0012DCFCC7|nr:hypothetical protein [Mesorhizobium sp. L2C066B000]